MIRRPPRSTLTDTLLPYTTLFRSAGPDTEILPSIAYCGAAPARRQATVADRPWVDGARPAVAAISELPVPIVALTRPGSAIPCANSAAWLSPSTTRIGVPRSEERRVGKECVSTCRSRWSPVHYKKKTTKNTDQRKHKARQR